MLPGGRARRELLAGADAPGQEVGVGVHLRHLSGCLHLLSRCLFASNFLSEFGYGGFQFAGGNIQFTTSK